MRLAFFVVVGFYLCVYVRELMRVKNSHGPFTNLHGMYSVFFTWFIARTRIYVEFRRENTVILLMEIFRKSRIDSHVRIL